MWGRAWGAPSPVLPPCPPAGTALPAGFPLPSSPSAGTAPPAQHRHPRQPPAPIPQPPAPLTRVLIGCVPVPVHGVEQGGHQPVVGLLVGADQVGERAETLGLDALDGLGEAEGMLAWDVPPIHGI